MSRLILVPLDGSGFAETALPVALTMAKAWDAEIEAVTVHEPIPALEHHLWDEASRQWTESYLKDVVSRVEQSTGAHLASATLGGSVADALQLHAQERSADLVVMASHGRGPMTRAWLGSVADTFVRHATTPVLIVRPAEGRPPDLAEVVCFDHVLIPLDGSEESRVVLDSALDLGKACDCRYTLLRVYRFGEEFAAAYLPDTVQLNGEMLAEGRDRARSNIEAQAEELVARGFRAEGKVVVDSSPAAGIMRAAEELDVDLIAMATHGRAGIARMLLGSVTDKVLRGAHTPILISRPPGV
ncbi:MAG: universal stress protein [Longimicrobiales bacterium]